MPDVYTPKFGVGQPVFYKQDIYRRTWYGRKVWVGRDERLGFVTGVDLKPERSRVPQYRLWYSVQVTSGDIKRFNDYELRKVG